MVERGLDRRMPLRLLQAMLAQATDAIVLLSPKNRILAAAGATQEIFGVASEGLIGRSFSRFVAPAARREQRVRLSRMLTLPIEDSRLTVELPVLKNDGCILMCDASSATLVEDGERTGRLVLLRDATARRAVEAALRASEARLQRESERLLALHEASTLLAVQTAGASEIFEQVLRSAVNLLGGGSGSLYRWDPESKLLRCVYNWQVPESDVTPDVRSGQGLAGQTYLQREPIIVNDYPNWKESMRTGLVGGMKAGLGVPLMRHGACLGVLLVRVYTDDQTRPFDQDDARLATLFGDQVAAALLAAEAFEQQRQVALHDSLTGLPNRTLLADRVQQAILAARREGTPLTLLVLDLDRFKDVNDTLGHAAGDLLLQEVAARLSAVVRASDTVARLGGDEFAVLLRDSGAGHATSLIRKLTDAIEQPFVQNGHVIQVGLSVGAAMFPEHGDDTNTLQRHADVAMYAAKRAGGGYVAYTLERGEHNRDRLVHLGELRQAIDCGQLVVHYQPKIQCVERRVTGVEALVRWDHPERGLLGPDAFVPLAEQSGLIKQVTRHVLEAAIGQSRAWRARGIELSVAVNVSMRDLHDPQLPELIASLLAAGGVGAGSLELEITESALMADPARALAVLHRLRVLGLKVAIDDFGTGYSSLAYLKRLPVDVLKIDKSFILQLATDPSDLAIVRSVIELGHNLGLTVVAEGVEDAASWRRLTELGCDTVQGYYFGRPAPAAEFERWLLTDQDAAVARLDGQDRA